MTRGESAPTPFERGSAAHFHATADRWDAAYDAASVHGHWWRTRAARAAVLVGDGPGELLEVGAGPGRLLTLLAARGWTCHAIDPAPRMVELARGRVESAHVLVARAEALPFPDGSMDVAVSVGVLEYTELAASLGEIRRVLAPAGRAVLGFRNGRAPVLRWQYGVTGPAARTVKRVAAGIPPHARRRRRALAPAEAAALVEGAGFAVERLERLACAVLPDPLDRALPGLAARAAARAEDVPRLRRLLGTQLLLVARPSAR